MLGMRERHLGGGGPGHRAFQAEGTASAKPLRLECIQERLRQPGGSGAGELEEVKAWR